MTKQQLMAMLNQQSNTWERKQERRIPAQELAFHLFAYGSISCVLKDLPSQFIEMTLERAIIIPTCQHLKREYRFEH